MSKLTVGEAKTMGVEFVCGDYLSVSSGGPIIQVSPSSLNDINGSEFAGLYVKQLSWRPHETSGKPTDIDYPVLVFVDEEECKGMISDFYWNIDDSRSSIVKWKPDLVELERMALKSVQVETPEEKEAFEAMQNLGEIKVSPEVELIPKARLRNSRSAMKKRIKRRDKTISKKQVTINLLKSDIEGMEREVNALCSIFGKQFVGSRNPESLGDNDWGFMQLFDAISDLNASNRSDGLVITNSNGDTLDWDMREGVVEILDTEQEWPQNGDKVCIGNAVFTFAGYVNSNNPSINCIIYTEIDNSIISTFANSSDLSKHTKSEIVSDKHKEKVNEICEDLFGEMASQCREDVVATVRAMVEGGYIKD